MIQQHHNQKQHLYIYLYNYIKDPNDIKVNQDETNKESEKKIENVKEKDTPKDIVEEKKDIEGNDGDESGSMATVKSKISENQCLTPEVDKGEEDKFFKSKGDAFRTKRMGFWETGDELPGKVSPRGNTKPEDNKDIIEDIKNLDIFDSLKETDLELLVESMYVIEFQEGEVVINKGDTGTSFYYVKDGEFVDEEGKVHKYFCEPALLYKYESPITIKAKSQGTVYAIRRLDYQRLQMTKAKEGDQNNIDFLAQVPILRPLTERQRVAIATSLQERIYNKDDMIVKQGDMGDTFYIIEEGEVQVREHRGDSTVDLVTRKRGDYFGEMALLKDEPRSADCIALGNVKCLTLSRAEFMELLGDLHELLEHNQAVRLLQGIELFSIIT